MVTGSAKKRRSQSASAMLTICSTPLPKDIRLRTVIACRFSLMTSGIYCGKISTSFSSSSSFPSSCSRPSAVMVYVFVKDWSPWTKFGAYGAHQPSAQTFPCRAIMSPCISVPVSSKASKRFSSVLLAIPASSGVQRGSIRSICKNPSLSGTIIAPGLKRGIKKSTHLFCYLRRIFLQAEK